MVRMTGSHKLLLPAMMASVLMAALFATAVVGVAAPPAPVVTQGPVAPQRVVVKDPENRFTITVPANWAVQTSTGARKPAVSAQSPAASGQLPDSVEVITQDLPTAISAEECADKAAQVMRFTIHNWTTLHQGAVTLAGLPGYSRAYTWHTSSGQDRRSDQTCVTVGRRAFVVIGTTANDQRRVQQELPQLQRIIATFHPNTSNLPPDEHPAKPVSRPPGNH